jgi:hypothetical protein
VTETESKLAEALEREAKRDRFIEQIKTADEPNYRLMIAQYLFDIEQFQMTQNHNSTATATAVTKLTKVVYGEAAILATLLIFILTENDSAAGRLVSILGALLRKLVGL